MNQPSVEYGVLVKGASYDDVRKAAHQDEGPLRGLGKPVMIHGCAVETRPHDPGYLFIAFGDLGEDMVPATPRGRQVLAWFRKNMPKARVKWGVIHTQR